VRPTRLQAISKLTPITFLMCQLRQVPVTVASQAEKSTRGSLSAAKLAGHSTKLVVLGFPDFHYSFGKLFSGRPWVCPKFRPASDQRRAASLIVAFVFGPNTGQSKSSCFG
jgi:hypothetical protein